MRKLATITAAAAALAFAFGAGQAVAATLVVNDTGAVDATEPAPCDTDFDHTTIQAAITAASDGDEIVVCPGVYTEDLSITTDNLELAGTDKTTTTIVGVDTVLGTDFPLADPNINIEADGVYIHGFTIKSPTVAAARYSSGIVLTGTDIEITDNAFVVGTGDVSQGIQTYRDDNAAVGFRDISDLYIHHNSFTHLGPTTGVGLYEGIFINHQTDAVSITAGACDAGSTVRIKFNVFSGNLIRAVTTERSCTEIASNTISTDSGVVFTTFPRGIQIQDFSARDVKNVSVSSNAINVTGTGAVYDGIILAAEVQDSTVSLNDIDDALNNGILLKSDAHDNVVNNNRVETSGASGIVIAGDDNDLISNLSAHNGDDGIIMTGDDNDATGNNTHHNAGDGLEDAGSGNTCPTAKGPPPKRNKSRKNDGADFVLCP